MAGAIDRINEVVRAIEMTQATIEAAVEQQTHTVQNLGEAAVNAAQHASEIADDVDAIASAASDTSRAVTETTVAANGVTGGKAMGEVIKAVRARVGADASGQRIAAAVKQALNP